MRGEERFSAPGNASSLAFRFSAGGIPGAKAHFEMELSSVGLKSSSPCQSRGLPPQRVSPKDVAPSAPTSRASFAHVAAAFRLAHESPPIPIHKIRVIESAST
jgi:hypothetical protein